MKKGAVIGLVLISLMLMGPISFISAGWFSNFFGKITGQAVGPWGCPIGQCLDSNSHCIGSGFSTWPGNYCINCPANDKGTWYTCYCGDKHCTSPENSNNCPGDCGTPAPAPVYSTYYRDADLDGYGSGTYTDSATSKPVGYVTNNNDCNDADAAVNPGATEICNGVDDNCDGQIDEGDVCTCIDSDGGLDYYVKGTAYDNIETPFDTTDTCLNSNTLKEFYCTSTGVSSEDYICPNGCSDGACVNADTSFNIKRVWSEKDMMNAGSYMIYIELVDSSGNSLTIDSSRDRVYLTTTDSQGRMSGPYNLGTSSQNLAYINKNYYGAGLFASCSGVHKYNVTVIYNGISKTSLGEVSIPCLSSSSCSDSDNGKSFEVKGTTVDSIGNSLTDYCNPDWYPDYFLVEGYCDSTSKEALIWSQYCPNGCSDGACIVSNATIPPAPNRTTCTDSDGGLDYYAKGKVSGFDEFGASYSYEDICEPNPEDNSAIVLKEMYCNEGKSLSAPPYTCPYGCSEGACISKNIECVAEYSCETTPTICPNSGVQTKTCKDTSCGNEGYTEQINCNPGICSGCHITQRTSGAFSNLECIPYGFRIRFGNNEQISLNLADVVSELSEEGIDLIINPDSSMNISLSEDMPFTFTANGVQYGKQGDSKIVHAGENYAIVFEESGRSITYRVSLDEIRYLEDVGAQYFTFTVDEGFNAYCDIDGQLKEQKKKDTVTNLWADCQNSYECDSNLCSRGQCIEILDMTEQANVFKVIVIKIICKLSNFFSLDDYSQCLGTYLTQ